MPRSLTLQGCFARVPSAKPNIQTTTKSAGLAFKGDTLASCPARGARACSGKTAVSFNDDPKVALGGFGSSRCALGRLQLVHEGAVRSPLGALVLGVQSLDPWWSAKNLKMEEKVNNKRKSESRGNLGFGNRKSPSAREKGVFISTGTGVQELQYCAIRYLRYDTFSPFLGTTNLGSTCAHNRAQSPSD